MGLFKHLVGNNKSTKPNEADPLLDIGITHLENGEYPEAESAFQQLLSKDPDYGSYEKLDTKVRQLSKNNAKFNLALSSRQALLGLGIIRAMQHDFRNAEDFILDAVYSAQEAGLFMIAGKYYLAIPDAELSTAFGYFELAVPLQPSVLEKCDELVQIFIKGRGVYYPLSALNPYINLWNTTKEKFSKKAKENQSGSAIDAFTTRMLQVLEILDIVGQNRLKSQFK